MVLRTLMYAGFFFGVATGCTSPADGLIDFRVTGGLSGRGDGTALHVEPDGTATRTNPDGGMQTVTLDPTTLAILHREIDDAQFPTLAPSYPGCCDHDVYDVTLQQGGATYHVSADSAAQIPAGLSTLIGTLQDIIRRPLDWQ